MLLPVANGYSVDLIDSWLGQKENYQWLDFGSGNQIITPVSVKALLQRDTNLVRLFCANASEMPIGLVALSNVARNFRTATLWYVLGTKQYEGHGYTTGAVSDMLKLAFTELQLRSVNAWAVEHNAASISVLRSNHFRLIGRQRQCHYIDGCAFDRLLFDLLAVEHREITNGGR